jgi:WD40 repeat protein
VLYTQAALRKGEGCYLTVYQPNVKCMAFHGSGRLLACGSTDRTVRLWDVNAKKQADELWGHTGAVNSVAFSPDGRLLASASDDETVRLWDVVERQPASPIDVLRGHTNGVWSVSFSPDGRQLASASHDANVRLWSVPDGVPGPILQHPVAVFCVAFSPAVGSSMLASGCSNGIVRLWDVSGINPHLMRELHGHLKWINSIAFSRDGGQLVSGSMDNTVRLWSMVSGQLLKTLTGHLGTVNCVDFHPNGKQVASASVDKTVRIWTVCEWSDRVHQLFGPEMKRLVFCLMCVRDKLERMTVKSQVPQLPIVLWLEIFQYAALNCT